MRRTISMLAILSPLLLLTAWAALAPPADEGAITISPDSGVAGHFGTWTVRAAREALAKRGVPVRGSAR